MMVLFSKLLLRKSANGSFRERGVVAVIACLLLSLVACSGNGGVAGDDPSSVNSSDSAMSSSSYRVRSSSSITKAVLCKTEEEDACEYGTLTDERDGQIYKTVKIGDQWWMAENLNYAILEPSAREDSSSFCYNNVLSNCKVYGRLYTWAVAVGKSDAECGYGKKCSLPSKKIQGICPDGWRVPSEQDILVLLMATDAYSRVGTMLKATGSWLKDWLNQGPGTDDYGFSGLAAGLKTYDSDYRYDGVYTYFWSSTEVDAYHAHVMSLEYSEFFLFWNLTKFRAHSVRCLKNSADDWDDDDGGDDDVEDVSSSVTMTMPCKTKTEDNCEYGSLTDKRDGRTYRTVKIGDHWWMAENLSYPYLQPTLKHDSSSFCVNNDSALCDSRGRLYLWSAAMDSAALFSLSGKGCGWGVPCSANGVVRGVCPEGWHLPDTLEFNNLFASVGGEIEASLMLRSTSGWEYDRLGGEGGIDAFGFTARPAGIWVDNRNTAMDYRAQDASAAYWTSTKDDGMLTQVYHSALHNDCDQAFIWNSTANDAYSVRCVKD